MNNNDKEIIKLNNGLKLLIIPLNTKLFNITVNILLGYLHEKKNEMELTHYLEHIMATFTSKKYQDSNIIKKELNKRGAYSNAHVNEYITTYYIEGLYKDAEYYIDLISNMLNNFYIDKSIVNVEKKAVIQELNNYIADPQYIFNLKIWKYMFYNSHYLGDNKLHIEYLNKYNPDNLYDYFKKHILLKNTLISVTCPIEKKQETILLLKKAFNFKNNNKKYIIEYPTFNYHTHNIKVLFVKNKNIDDNSILEIIVSKNILINSSKHLCLNILNYILFNFEDGVFYNILRRQLGLIYNINLNVFIDIHNQKSSSYSINSNIIYNKIPDLIYNIIKIFENINITDEQIINAKLKLLIREEYKKFYNLNTYSSYYGQYILFNNPIIERNEYIKLYDKIDNKELYKELNNMKNDIFNNSLFFYYSNKNMNNKIKNKLNKHNIHHKIKYIDLN